MIDIKKTRERLDFSQAELAQVVGVTTRTIQNWEAGISSPKPKQVEIIERVLQVIPEQTDERREPDTVSRLISIIESQQRVIETLTRS